jgi:hypothetical protein
MASTISAGTTTTTALVYSADTSGVLQLQTNGGTTALTLDTSQNATFAGKVASASSLQLATNGTTTAVTIDTNQNFGLGVTPSAWVTGHAMEFGAVGNALWGYSGNIVLSQNTAGYSSSFLYATTAAATRYQQNAGSHLWSNAPSGTAGNAITFTQAMTLDASGNLLVGTTSQLSNGLICASFNPSVKQGITLQNSSGTNCVYIGFNNASNSQIGYISGNGTLVAYNTSSDYRLKENIVPLTNALEKIALLKPSLYNYKSDSSTQIEGFIAHELQTVVPHAVTGEKDAVDENGNPVYQGVDASFLIPHLVASIQELSAQVTTLQTQVTALKG